MKRSHTLILATTLTLLLAAGFGQTASAAVSQRATPTRAIARGKIGTALPRAGAAARIRALGRDDSGGEVGSDDGSGLASRAQAARGTIGGAAPTPNAAARIAALGFDD